MNHPLTSTDPLTELAKQKGISTWNELTTFVKTLPYGRNNNRSDLSLVLSEMKGTCSSKHALLKQMADLNHIPDVKLILGIYKMNRLNTPGIGTALDGFPVDFIPEAHCYLKVAGERMDITTPASDINNLETDIMEEREITPGDVDTFKVDFHQTFIRKWIADDRIPLTFERIWQIRETCINHLSA